MGMRLKLLLAGSVLCLANEIVLAQSGDQPLAQAQDPNGRNAGDDLIGAIFVVGDRLRGQLNVEQAPVLELNEADIQAIGATSVAELFEAIAPQTGSSRGRGSEPPVFLVNGIRVGSFREMRSYPPEAIAKVEVLPEEVAQKLGFPPDRRVVNLILKENYSSREAQLEFAAPSRGGNSRTEQEFTLLKINQGARLNVNVEANDVSMLTEAERGVIQTPGSVPDGISDEEYARFRSLTADSFGIQGSVNWARAIVESGSSLSFNLTGEHTQSRSLSGLRDIATLDPLERRNDSDKISSSASIGRRLGEFQLTITSDNSWSDSTTRIDRNATAGFDNAQSETLTSASKATLEGGLFELPAGEVTANVNAGFDWKRIESSDTRSATDSSFTRRRLEGGASLVVPIAERDGVLGALGNLSANFSAGFEDLSDFGGVNSWTAGLTWSPAPAFTLSATRIASEAAPSLTQLGSPQTTTFNVPVFDFVRGESVLAAVTLGGNPDLLAERQRDWKFNASWELPFWKDTRFSVDYVRNNSSDVTGNFPAVTAEVEAAFPDRITRDGSGQITAVDARSVTYDQSRTRRLVFGLTTRGSFGPARPPSSDAPQSPPNGGFAGREPGGEGRGGPPSDAQRAAFMRFRGRVCADDGVQVLIQLVEAVQRGEDLSLNFPDFDPQRAARMVERLSDVDGTIDHEKLEQFRKRVCSMDPSQIGQRGPGGPPPATAPAGRRGGGAPTGFGGRGDDGRGRYFANLTHTIELANTVLIAEGGPLLDLLGGDATSDFATPRHTSSLEVGVFRNGRGVRLSGRYSGKSRIDGSGMPGSTDLYFGDLLKLDLRVFADLGRLFKQDQGLLKNFRISLRADNVFDAHRRVTDSDGNVPLSYQPDLIDPNGRYLGFDLRKMF